MVYLIGAALLFVGGVLLWLLSTPDPVPVRACVEDDAAYGVRVGSAGYHAGGRR